MHIDFIKNNIASLHGEVKGIIGKDVKEVRPFQLLSLEKIMTNPSTDQIMH